MLWGLESIHDPQTINILQQHLLHLSQSNCRLLVLRQLLSCFADYMCKPADWGHALVAQIRDESQGFLSEERSLQIVHCWHRKNMKRHPPLDEGKFSTHFLTHFGYSTSVTSCRSQSKSTNPRHRRLNWLLHAAWMSNVCLPVIAMTQWHERSNAT